jgi:hypothetical protein
MSAFGFQLTLIGISMSKKLAISLSSNGYSNGIDTSKGYMSWLGSDLESSIFQWMTLSELLTTWALVSRANRVVTFDHFKRTSTLHIDEIVTIGDVKAFRICQRLRSLTFVNDIPTPANKRIRILQGLLVTCVMHNRATLQVHISHPH